jgi:hypothetical protein
MIIYQTNILRSDLRANPSVLYVFGDNIARTGFGGQAAEFRGEPNTVGIPTKFAPDRFFDDKKLTGAEVDIIEDAWNREIAKISNTHIVVFPARGIGTGLARLESKSPYLWKLLNKKLDKLGIINPLFY